MNEELMKSLIELFGDKETLQAELAKRSEAGSASDALTEAIEVMKGYKEDFPEDLAKAVGTLSLIAASGTEEATTAEKSETSEPQGDKLDQVAETLGKLATHLMPAVEKSENEETDRVDKLAATVEKLAEVVLAKSETSKGDDNQSSFEKSLKLLNDRLTKMEQSPASTKSSVDGQETGGVEKSEDDDKVRWPSLMGE